MNRYRLHEPRPPLFCRFCGGGNNGLSPSKCVKEGIDHIETKTGYKIVMDLSGIITPINLDPIFAPPNDTRLE